MAENIINKNLDQFGLPYGEGQIPSMPQNFVPTMPDINIGANDLNDFATNMVPGLGQHIQDLENIKNTTRGAEYFRESTNNMIQNLSDAYGRAPVVGGINRALIETTASPISGFLSPLYETYSAYDRMEPGSGFEGFREAFAKENAGTAMANRFVGAAQPLANRIQSGNFPLSLNNVMDMGRSIKDGLGNFFFSPAGAAEISPTTNRNFDRDFSMFDQAKMGDAISRPNVQSQNYNMDQSFYMNPNSVERPQNMFQRLGGAIQDGIGSLQDVAGKGIDLGKMAMSGIGNAIMPGLGFVGDLLSGFDKFDTLSPEDQAFILDQAGGNRPAKDPFGINIRSARGNYADYVRSKGIYAKGKRGDYYRSISDFNPQQIATLQRERKAKRAYEKQIKDAADAASRNAARARSITAGYGGSDDSRGATGPTASGAGMGVGGGYATDHGFLKDGGMIGYRDGGLASMFVRRG